MALPLARTPVAHTRAMPQCAALKEEIRRLERNARREGANLEYLKNIVLRYLETSVGRDR